VVLVNCTLRGYHPVVSSLPELPAWIAQYGPWSGSVHEFQHPLSGDEDEFGPFDVLVLAKENRDGMAELKGIRIMPKGDLGLPPRPRKTGIGVPPSEWLPSLLPVSDSAGSIDMAPAGDFFTAFFSRRILTGHLIALRFFEIVQAREVLRSTSGKTQSMKFSLPKREGESVTIATLRLSNELQAWGETTPAKVISEVEGVSLTTIYNRLHTGRAQSKK